MNTLPRYASAALQLQGTGFVDLGAPQSLSFGGFQSYTVEAWINLASTAGSQTIIGKFNGGVAAEYSLSVNDGYLTGYRNVAPWTVQANAPMSANEWHHVSMTYDGHSHVLSLYVDGDLAGQGNVTSQPSAPALNVYIGAVQAQGQPTAFFNGQIASVAIWNTCRTIDQIIPDTFEMDVPNDPTLVAYYNFAAIPPVEQSGNNLGMTFNGDAQYLVSVPGMLLSGAGQYADCGNNPAYSRGGAAPYTIEGWFSPAAIPQTGSLIGKFDGGVAAEYNVSVVGASVQSYRNVGPWSCSSLPALQAGQFYHFATTYDGAVLRVYLNGNLHAAQTFTTQPASPQLDLLVGACLGNGSPTNFFQGLIQNLRLWSVSLAEEDIREFIYGDPVDDPDLIADFDFTVNPPVDTAGNNPIQLLGGAAIGYQSLAVTPGSEDALLGYLMPTSSQAPEYVDYPAPVAPTATAVAAQPAPFSEAHRTALRDEVAAGTHGDTAQALQAFDAAYQRAEKIVAARPTALTPLQVRTEGDDTVLVHRTVRGDVEIFRSPTAQIDPLTLWWIQLVYMLTVGFWGALGLVPTPGGVASRVAQRVYAIVYANVQAMSAIQQLIAGTISVGTLMGTMKVLYNNGLLWPILKFALSAAGWWTLAWALRKAIAYVTGLEAASALAGFIVWQAQLVQLVAQKPASASTAAREALAA